MSKTKKWTDQLGHEIRVGDFIAYGVARANISFAVVYEVNSLNLKIKYPEFKQDWGTTPVTVLGWKARKSTLTTTDIVVIPIDRIIEVSGDYRQYVSPEHKGKYPTLNEEFRKLQDEILKAQI